MTRETFLILTSAKIKRLMNKKDISYAELADRAYIDKSTIHRILNCKVMPSVRVMVNIAVALDVGVEDLVPEGNYMVE